MLLFPGLTRLSAIVHSNNNHTSILYKKLTRVLNPVSTRTCIVKSSKRLFQSKIKPFSVAPIHISHPCKSQSQRSITVFHLSTWQPVITTLQVLTAVAVTGDTQQWIREEGSYNTAQHLQSNWAVITAPHGLYFCKPWVTLISDWQQWISIVLPPSR